MLQSKGQNRPPRPSIQLIEGERAPLPHPMAQIDWPAGKPPGGHITWPQNGQETNLGKE